MPTLSSVPSVYLPEAWATGTTPIDFRKFSYIELQVTGLSGGDTITVSRSATGVANTYYNQALINSSDNTTPLTISADGQYLVMAGGFMKWTQTGSASTPSVIVRGGN